MKVAPFDFDDKEKFGSQNEVYEDELVAAHWLAFIKTNAWQLFQKEEYYVDLSQNHLIYIWKYDTEFKGSNKLPEVDIYTGAGK